MSQLRKILDKVLSETSDKNISFTDLCLLLRNLGFKERINGSHHIFKRDEIPDRINLQPKEGKAKAYQVKQVRAIVKAYKLGERL